MEISKINESFSIKDTNDVYEMNGNVTREVAGILNLHFNVNKLNGEYVGDCSYNSYGENDNVNFGVNCSEENRDSFTAYADTIIDSVLEHFKTV